LLQIWGYGKKITQIAAGHKGKFGGGIEWLHYASEVGKKRRVALRGRLVRTGNGWGKGWAYVGGIKDVNLDGFHNQDQ